LYATSLLTFLTGLTVVIGCRKTTRLKSIVFFFITTSSAVWALSTALFLQLPDATYADILVKTMYCSAAVLFGANAVFASMISPLRISKALLISIVVLPLLAICTVIILFPELLYSGIIIEKTAHTISLVNGLFLPLYIAYLALCTLIFVVQILVDTRNMMKRKKRWYLAIFFTVLAASLVAGFCNFFLPLQNNLSYIWAGPLATVASTIIFYVAIVNERLFVIRLKFLQLLSRIIIIMSAVMVYMIIFFIVFVALFKIPNPAPEVFVLNFIMATIILLLLPVINELTTFVRSLITDGEADIGYVVKKLNKLAGSNVDLNELAGFLAHYMHFTYIGFIVDNRYYGSYEVDIPDDAMVELSSLPKSSHFTWQNLKDMPSEAILRKSGVQAVAQLVNARGEPFAQILIGSPLGLDKSLEKYDLAQLEVVLNLVAAIIDSEQKPRGKSKK
jgi:hypothetical protein